MMYQVIQVGDEVVIDDNEDEQLIGLKATVIGFGLIAYGHIHNFGLKHGIYHSKMDVRLELENGTKASRIFGSDLKLINEAEYERRCAIWVKMPHRERHDDAFVRDLPKLPFWEEDRVYCLTDSLMIEEWVKWKMKMREEVGKPVLVISGIDYNSFLEKEEFDTPKMKVMNILQDEHEGIFALAQKIGSPAITHRSAEELELAERGNVWRFYHNRPLQFNDLEDEAKFFYRIGQTDEVFNPKTHKYQWTRAQALEAVGKGLGHCIHTNANSMKKLSLLKYLNENVGKRIAKATLDEGFMLIGHS